MSETDYEWAQKLQTENDRLTKLLDAKRQNFLKEYSTEWEHDVNDGKVMCHHKMIGGVLCRWWGDGPEPKGVAVINAIEAIIKAK